MTKAFKEMDPEVVRKLLEGHENVIQPEIAREESFLKNVGCPACGGSNTEARINPKRPFAPKKVLPNKLLFCASCGAEFDPHSRIILKPPTGGSD